jgi:hypothetical protein
MSAGSTFNNLPPWAKGGIAVLGSLTVVAIGYAIYSGVKGRIKQAGDYKEQNAVKDDIKDLAAQNIKPSFTDSQYAAWANQILAAFNGYQSDESAVYRIFVNMKNDADVLKLINAYGIREISSGTGNPQANFKGTLAGAIADEFDTDEVKELNVMLAKRGIKIKF